MSAVRDAWRLPTPRPARRSTRRTCTMDWFRYGMLTLATNVVLVAYTGHMMGCVHYFITSVQPESETNWWIAGGLGSASDMDKYVGRMCTSMH